MAEKGVELKITANGAQARNELGGVAGELDRLGLKQTAVAQASQQVAGGFDSIGRQINAARTQMLAFLGVQQGLAGAKQLSDIVDGYRNLEGRIKLVVGEGKQLADTMESVRQVALRTNSDLTETGNLFARLAKVGKDAGQSTKDASAQALGLTETINQAIQISGASADASKAALTQLIQGLQGGTLRGDEFNSVMEQAPRLAQALADGLGVTTGELRKMANEGQLTSATVIASLTKQSDAVQAEFGKLPPTVGRAMQNLHTEFTKYINDQDQAHGYSSRTAEAIGLLARNLGTVADAMLHAGQTFGAWKALNMAQTWIAAKMAIEQETAATASNTASKGGNAAATAKVSTAVQANTAAVQANTAAQDLNQAAQARGAASTNAGANSWRQINLEVARSKAALDAATGTVDRLAQQLEQARATTANLSSVMGSSSVQTRNAAAAQKTLEAEYAKAVESAKTASRVYGENRASLESMRTASIDAAAAKRGVGAAAEGAAKKTGLLSGAFGAVMRSVGPLVALDIALNFKRYGTAIGEAAAKLMGYKDRSAELAAQEKLNAEIAKEAAKDRQRLAAATQAAIDRQFDLSKAAAGAVGKFQELTKDGKAAAEAVAEVTKGFDLTKVAGIRDFAYTLDKLAADGKINATEFRAAWSNALDGKDLLQFETMAKAAFAQARDAADKAAVALQDAIARGVKGDELAVFRKKAEDTFAAASRESERLAQLQDSTVREAIKRTGLEYDNLQGKIGAVARSAINDTDQIIAGLDKLKAQGVDTGRALSESIGKSIATADSQQAIEALQGQIESLRGELGSTVTNGLLDQAKKRAEELKDALDRATPGITSAREAMAQLGVETDKALGEAATKAKASYDRIASDAKSSTREVSEAFKAAAEAAIKASDGVAPEWVKLEAKARGYRLEVNKAGDAHLEMADKARAGADGVAAAFERMGLKTKSELKGAADQARRDYETIQFSGQASADQLQNAFKRYAEAAIEANGGVASSFLQDEAAVRGLVITYDNTGKTVVRTAAEMGGAMERAMRRGNQAIEGQMGYLERLAKRNQEVADSSIMNLRDKDGFSTDGKGGPRIGQEKPTWTSVYNMVKQMGLPDDQARNIADQAYNPDGSYNSGLQRSQMRGQWDSIDVYEAARRAAEKQTRAAGGGTGGASAVAGTGAANDAAPSSGGGNNYVVNVTIDGRKRSINTKDQASQQALQDLVRELGDASRRAA